MTTSVIERLDILIAALRDISIAMPGTMSKSPSSLEIDGYLEHIIALLQQLQRAENSAPTEIADDQQIGKTLTNLLDSIIAWTIEHHQPHLRQQLAPIYLDTMELLVERGFRIPQLNGLVNVLADITDYLDEANLLVKLTLFMQKLIAACDDTFSDDKAKTNPGRPWRILHLNYAIVATRSQRTDLQEQAYDTLCLHLPEESPQFFAEAMQQMENFNYPDDVKNVVARYHRQFTENKMH